ncbi:TPA: hypothetical protein VJS58_001805, partial [Streptococcus pyogenes]|nr:hypothetical protein [Streptococcus pyogenes]
MAREERDRIRKQQREEIDVALRSGATFGRPKVQATEEFKEVYNHWKVGEVTAVKVMGELDVKKTTFYMLVKEYERDLKKKTAFYKSFNSGQHSIIQCGIKLVFTIEPMVNIGG